MAEEAWHAARLIPTSGINGAEEQERRATSALLAVMTTVREFSKALLRPLGAPAGSVATYIEVPFRHQDRKAYPDGLIRVTRGQQQWTALVEVKTGPNALDPTQLETYLDIAREHQFDAVVTISNEIPAIPGQHPTVIDRRRLRKVALVHWSWSQVLTEAIMQKEHRGVADPEQAWILGELIRYLEHPRSGALEFDDMGGSWVPVRDAIAAGTLRPNDAGVADVANRFDALLRFAGLRLGRRLGAEVTPALSRKELSEPATRASALAQQLAAAGSLTGGIRIPSTVGTLTVTADVRAGQITCHVDVDAPREGRPTTRVNWLSRQLKDAPDGLRIESTVLHGRGVGCAALLREIREDPTLLVADPARELKSFRVAHVTRMGAKRGTGRGSFIDSVTEAVDVFYESVLQNLKAWSAKPPRLRPDGSEVIEEQPDVASALVSTALSSQDGDAGAAMPRWRWPATEPAEA